MQSLEEQISVIERALGERMIDTALVVVRSWLNELGESNIYEEAYNTIRKEYDGRFVSWLSGDDSDTDEALDGLTGRTYQLVDAVYAEIRVKRGLSPAMHGFNQDNPQSVMQYFQHCVRLRDEDLEWFHEVTQDPDRTSAALMASAALAHNLRECFSTDAFLALIDGMGAESEIVSDQCIANVLTLLIHYDVRIDYFDNIQEMFVNTLAENGLGDHVFDVLLAVVESASPNQSVENYVKGVLEHAPLPDELKRLMDMAGLKNGMNDLVEWFPKTENDYMIGLVNILPDTWLYELLVAGQEEREKRLAYTCVKAGFRNYMWNSPDNFLYVFRDVLRKGSLRPLDYINYAHCLLLTGDRIMAYEYYRQARQLCNTSKEFFSLFRPDRRALMDHGVPVEQIYLIEDRLVNL